MLCRTYGARLLPSVPSPSGLGLSLVPALRASMSGRNDVLKERPNGPGCARSYKLVALYALDTGWT
jgi:hypothetical protein